MRLSRLRSAGDRAAAALVSGAVVLACGACSSGGTGSTTQTAMPLVGFVAAAAVAANGPIPKGTAVGTCGSPKYGWVSELVHESVTKAKVRRHWAAFIRTGNGLAARQMEASGTIATINIGSTDVPFDHPFGGDMSFEEHVDQQYTRLDQNLGTSGGNPAATIHDELMTGLLPHPLGAVDVSNGTAWPQFAANTGRNIAAGFTPQAGDRVAVMGSWVVDCGHTDFHSELHSVTFMAYGHRQGSVTVAHAFYNPFEVAQVFNPDPSLAGRVTDPALLRSPATQDLPKYLITEILRLAEHKDRQPTAPVVLEANVQSPTPWSVCAPAGTTGTRLLVSYDFSVRPGVTVTVRPDQVHGCATVTTKLGTSYHPTDARGQVLCPTDWTWLSKHAFSEAATFGGTGKVPHSIPAVILEQVKRFAPALAAGLSHSLFRPLLSVCFPVMTVKDLGTPSAGKQAVTTNPTQVLPFAGWIEVSWAG